MNDRAETPAISRRAQSDRLKERIYLAFVALAVVLALGSHEVTAADALTTLAVTTLGTLLAVLVADVISHMIMTERTMTRGEFAHAVFASFGALSAVAVPVVALLIALIGWWSITIALRVSAAGLILSLVVIGFAGIRRVPMTWWQRLLALGAEAVVGLAVVGLQTLAHG
jgi:hypothetical protein